MRKKLKICHLSYYPLLSNPKKCVNAVAYENNRYKPENSDGRRNFQMKMHM
jgi:hypothetical protein